LDKKPCKILWDVPLEELMAVELAKAGCNQPSLLILHLKNFRRSENFARVIKCKVEDEPEGGEPQAVRICLVVHKMWKAASDIKTVLLKVGHVHKA
jgi:vacuolar protein sorting-associated protein 13A/C